MNQEPTEFIQLKESDLKEETLTALAESYVLQEGTDYGHNDYSLEEKVKTVLKQIKQKKAWIIYNFKTQSCTISHEPLKKNFRLISSEL